MNKFLKAVLSSITTFLILSTTYSMEEKKHHIPVLDTSKLAQSQSLFAQQADYSMLPLELCTTIAQLLIPQQINTTEELLIVLRNLTYLSEVDHSSKATAESRETKRALLYALAPDYLILEDFEKHKPIVKETIKVSKFFQDTLHSLKTQVQEFRYKRSKGLKSSIEELLEFGINPNFRIDGISLLIWTIESCDENAMDFVIDNGANVNDICRGYSALQTAIRTPLLAITLLKKYNVNPSTLMGHPLVTMQNLHDTEHHAARKKLIKVLVEKGLSANSYMTPDKYGHHLIFEAILLAQVDKKSDLVEFLLKKGAKVYPNNKYWNGLAYHTLYEYAKDLPEILALLKSHEQTTEEFSLF